MTTDNSERFTICNVEEEMKTSYLRYSMSVIISRALPDVRDGLKPSQRRILYAMKLLNLSPGGKHRKCAKISGDTSGDFHPHGEQVIYPTLVRMAQPWAMRYRLIDGQGNFGSVDGDPPAAMRYTEARLTHAAIQLMEDLDKETVDYQPNYDETKTEPMVFPALFPNLLCNGSSGIAVGMATNIPPHNLNELIQATTLLLDNPAATIDEMMRLMPGPDFPTGGAIQGYKGIKEAYHTGRGKLTLRGVLNVEPMEGIDREQIVITEIPYNINKARLIEQIAGLINDKVITGISDLRDESDKDGLRIVIELKKGVISDVVTCQLFKFSDLEVTFGCIMLALDKGLPQVMTIKQMVQAWITHRIEVVRKRTAYELKKAEARAHLLEGYLRALDQLDEVVRTIRASQTREQAKQELIHLFAFTEIQASAILDLRLYQLTGLERNKLQEEHQELLRKIDWYRSVLASEERVRGIIKEELLRIEETHKSPRQTEIVPFQGEMEMEDLIANEEIIIQISEDDYIKRMPVTLFREQKRGGQGISGVELKKEEDAIKGFYVAWMHDYLLIFTSLGRCYVLKSWQVPEASRKSKGKALINLLEDIQPNEKIETILTFPSFEKEACIFMATRLGVVKKSELKTFNSMRRKGFRAIEIDEGDELIAAKVVEKDKQVMLFTYQGSAVRFDESEVRPMGRLARGVRGVTLKNENDYVVGCEVVSPSESILVVCENGFGKRSLVDDFRATHRGGLGVRSILTSERNGQVISALSVQESDGVVMVATNGQTIRIRMSDVRVMGRSTQGVRLAQLKNDSRLLSVQKVASVAEELNDEEAKPEDKQEE